MAPFWHSGLGGCHVISSRVGVISVVLTLVGGESGTEERNHDT